jgi:hypothetical protein
LHELRIFDRYIVEQMQDHLRAPIGSRAVLSACGKGRDQSQQKRSQLAMHERIGR